MHRAEDDRTYVLVGVFGSNSYKCTEQKLTQDKIATLQAGSNSYKCTEQKPPLRKENYYGVEATRTSAQSRSASIP